jgi:hypothetical protein
MTTLSTYPFASTQKRRDTTAYPVLTEFRQHLETDRGLRASERHLAAATCFLDFLGVRGRLLDTRTKALPL